MQVYQVLQTSGLGGSGLGVCLSPTPMVSGSIGFTTVINCNSSNSCDAGSLKAAFANSTSFSFSSDMQSKRKTCVLKILFMFQCVYIFFSVTLSSAVNQTLADATDMACSGHHVFGSCMSNAVCEYLLFP